MLQKGEKMKKAIAANEKTVRSPIMPIKGPPTGLMAASKATIGVVLEVGEGSKKESGCNYSARNLYVAKHEQCFELFSIMMECLTVQAC